MNQIKCPHRFYTALSGRFTLERLLNISHNANLPVIIFEQQSVRWVAIMGADATAATDAEVKSDPHPLTQKYTGM